MPDVCSEPLERTQCRRSERGYALVVTLWLTGLLALMAAVFTSAVRSHLRQASVAKEHAVVEALADAGANLAVQELAGSPSWGTGMSVGQLPAERVCAIDDLGMVRINVTDEAGRIDVNAASENLLQALFQGLGLDSGRARRLAAAIADFRDSDDQRRSDGAESQEYRIAGKSVMPKNAPLDSTTELTDVLGMDVGLLASVRPHVTVYSQQSGIDPAAANSQLLALLAPSRRLGSLAGDAANPAATGWPAGFVLPSQHRAYRIRSESIAGRARFVRDVVVEPTRNPAAPVKWLSWLQEEATETWPAPEIDTLPHCRAPAR